MSLDTYANLKTAIAQRMARSDKTALLADFISIAHSKMMKGQKTPDGRAWVIPPLRFNPMLTTDATLTPADGAVTLPTDYLKAKRLTSSTADTRPLEYMAPDVFRASGLYSESGPPAFYTIEGSSLLIMPANTDALSLLYYAKVAELSDSNTSNVILANIPHAYLYGALAEAFQQIRKSDEAAYYTAQFAGVVHGANDVDDEGQVAGGTLIMRPGVIP